MNALNNDGSVGCKWIALYDRFVHTPCIAQIYQFTVTSVL